MTRTMVMLAEPEVPMEEWASAVSAAAPGLRVLVAPDHAAAMHLLPDADAAFGTLDAQLLARAGRLAWLQAPQAAPPAGYFFPQLVAHPVQVTNFRGIYNDHVALHAVAMLLALARGLPRYLRQQQRHEWIRHLADQDILHLPESTVLVVGVGGIGGEIARMVHALGANVIGLDPRRTEPPAGMEAIFPPHQLDTLLPVADAVVLTLPHTPQSEGMIDARRLALMRTHALLVNVGRGATVRLQALTDALRAGRLGGAALDVFEQEPLPPGHPLWNEPRALLTPHVAVVGPYIVERRLAVLCDNARRFASGEPLVNVVDKANWY
ncbi:D-2-hydroxyacid dehydrogenase [Ramlibacter sp. RBP-2]|uniref:D-2-hydroxyacid dehydrogenase n=1 Tax=Ramlibacter lithotrophicus TaxID=2606681 RepID=A0A7X6I6F8_9BURK|nr:D-2-hydroxyacid dehydrogenase [Ramlibacter lithotrophicus]NKE66338.1 D-2-hydroxyacid dehydrogenase [Ramlibacter lithotrophicus]